MFNFFKKAKKNEGTKVVSPVTGDLIPLAEVNDDVFSQKMLGDGFAVKPSEGEVVSPISGTISTLFPTKHAIGVKTPEGLEVLIHLGLDTVELKGEPFDVQVAQGDSVKAGQKLADMDLKKITDSGLDDTVMVVYTNMDLLKEVKDVDPKPVKAGDTAQEIIFN
ncbi:PTS family glucose porter, IIA component [Lactobacillus equicursoris DSM 19284 = JCM 14600 = CIP 110162]|uniref:Glucose-specific phosphotransferase enzyme IIA component family protein n=1 Tax=Lactobacillus equicursoris DSM 19284 = JCM 14600 = CIP 110162 TaxID=1293597 RepID=K0NZQ2_9LACO|nr:PTS glucose transporter subunit IIA [Lactobacillus equicursoris]KRL01047.1 glucose-specific phosphotransferase enzyme IIA component family protein [Lactobacillus equicursoris DSM 19284 = JCM 14600 = CIP 110162]CCK85445.1 PTS family glucose porter, IIA component [Lactobacillus equicursoris DSM 19284 = JCM 14600 = CIP 110162]CCK86525.1 PTS family glucose porter, IIA component [Lactobacillus equicursoris DSM 19284 = JCM 14600 = CIP 110162]